MGHRNSDASLKNVSMRCVRSRDEPLAVDVALGGAKACGGFNFSVLLELKLAPVVALLRPVGETGRVGIARFGEVGPVGLNKLSKFHIDVCEFAGDVAGFGEIAEDVGQVSGVDRALRFLTGDGVVEFVLP